MRVVVAPDSFKGSLTAAEAARAMAEGVRAAVPEADIDLCPMADGGEGTLDVAELALGGHRVFVETVDPLHRPITVPYLTLPDGSAVVELAAASGLEHIAPAERTVATALRASTFGTGLVLAAALARGASTIYVTLGGSATTDGGFGLACALGLQAYDGDGARLDGTSGLQLAHIARLEATAFRERLQAAQWVLAVDVTNPLCGPAGAAAVYGPQKGLCGAGILQRNRELQRWSQLLRTAMQVPEDIASEPGMGAAGGAALPLRMSGQARVLRGADWAAEVCNLDDRMAQAALVITGEGQTDGQSAMGKVPSRVLAGALRRGVPCLVVSGALGEGWQALRERGAAGVYAASPAGVSMQEIRRFAAKWLCEATERAVRQALSAPG